MRIEYGENRRVIINKGAMTTYRNILKRLREEDIKEYEFFETILSNKTEEDKIDATQEDLLEAFSEVLLKKIIEI